MKYCEIGIYCDILKYKNRTYHRVVVGRKEETNDFR